MCVARPGDVSRPQYSICCLNCRCLTSVRQSSVTPSQCEAHPSSQHSYSPHSHLLSPIDSVLQERKGAGAFQLSEPTTTDILSPGGGDSHMEQTGMLVGNFEFNPYRRPTGRGSSKFGPQKRLFKNTKMRHAMSFNDIKA